MFYVLKTIFISFYLFLLCILAFLCISYNSTSNTEKFKSFVEVYPIEGNPIEVYPIEVYLIGKGVVGVSGCSLPSHIHVAWHKQCEMTQHTSLVRMGQIFCQVSKKRYTSM